MGGCAGISAGHHVRRKDDKQTSPRTDFVLACVTRQENHSSFLLSGSEGLRYAAHMSSITNHEQIQNCHLVHDCCLVHGQDMLSCHVTQDSAV